MNPPLFEAQSHFSSRFIAKRKGKLKSFPTTSLRSDFSHSLGRFRPLGRTERVARPRRSKIGRGCAKGPVDRCRWDESASFRHLMSLSGRKLGIAARNTVVLANCLPPTQIRWNRWFPPGPGGDNSHKRLLVVGWISYHLLLESIFRGRGPTAGRWPQRRRSWRRGKRICLMQAS